MLVLGYGAGDVTHLIAAFMQTPRQIGVFVVHEQVLAKSVELSPHRGFNGAGPATDPENPRVGVKAFIGGEPITVVAVAVAINEISGGVNQHGPSPRVCVLWWQSCPSAAIEAPECRFVRTRFAPAACEEQERSGSGDWFGLC